MKFARIVFRIAGIWGLLVIAPLYFLFNVISEKDPPAITHPGFFYGFVGVTLVWQIAFLFIAQDPVRFRPLMIPDSFVEQASQADMYAAAGLDRVGIVATVLETLGRDAKELPARA